MSIAEQGLLSKLSVSCWWLLSGLSVQVFLSEGWSTLLEHAYEVEGVELLLSKGLSEDVSSEAQVCLPCLEQRTGEGELIIILALFKKSSRKKEE